MVERGPPVHALFVNKGPARNSPAANYWINCTVPFASLKKNNRNFNLDPTALFCLTNKTIIYCVVSLNVGLSNPEE